MTKDEIYVKVNKNKKMREVEEMKNKEERKLVELAHEHSNTIITKKEAVDLFGTEAQKRHFKKHRSFVTQGIKVAFEKTLDQLFESVDTVKRGNRKDYELGSSREEMVAREDGRVFNRPSELSQTKYFEILTVLKVLQEPQGFTKSPAKWLEEFNLINSKLLQYKNNKMDTNDFLRLLGDNVKVDSNNMNKLRPELMFFIQDMQYTQKQFEAVLGHLHKDRIINLKTVRKANLTEEIEHYGDNGDLTSSDVVTLDYETEERILKHQTSLLNSLDITMTEVFSSSFNNLSPSKSQKVKQYKKGMEEYFNQGITFRDSSNIEHTIFIEYTWLGYRIDFEWDNQGQELYIKKRRPEFLENYLNKGYDMVPELIDNYNQHKKEYILRKAKKHIEPFINKQSNGEVLSYFEKHMVDNFMHNIEFLYPHLMVEHHSTSDSDEDEDEDMPFLDINTMSEVEREVYEWFG